MPDHMPDDLSAAGRDLREYTDELRPEYPVVRNVAGEWVLLRHAEVVAAAVDHDTFSSAVSRYLQVPNGLDGDTHTAFREALDPFFGEDVLAPHVPQFERIATQIVADVPRGKPVDAVHDIGALFAVRAQSGWLGWPTELEGRLLAWMEHNHAATRSGDHAWMIDVADDFDEIIRSVLQPRQDAGADAPDDLTTRLLRVEVQGRRLTDPELVSILRNWTGGDLGSIALCVGIVLHYLATHPDLIDALRGAPDEDVDAAIDEILRIDDPFVTNRRITTHPIRIAGQELPTGARVKLHWTSANRDEGVFGPDFDPVAHADDNLVYGIGKHVCPGRPLATMQLRTLVRTVLRDISDLRLAPEEPEREVAPVGGYHRVPIILR